MIERAFELTKEEEESRGKRHNRTIDPREASIFLTRNVLRSFSRLTREKMMKEEREEEKSLSVNDSSIVRKNERYTYTCTIICLVAYLKER